MQELTPEKTLKILRLIKGIDIKDMDQLSDGIKKVKKVVSIAVGRRFKCANSELIQAFLGIVKSIPVDEYMQISEIINGIGKVRQK